MEGTVTRYCKQLVDNNWDKMDLGKDLEEPKLTVIPTRGKEDDFENPELFERCRISP